jgi:hypothetical protein
MADDPNNPFETPQVQDALAPVARTYERPEQDVASEVEYAPRNAAELVEVASPLTLAEAEVLRAALRGSGIETHLRDHHTVAANALLGGVVGGVKVLVPHEEAEHAKQVLAERKSNLGRPVFRVIQRPFGAYAFIGLIVGFVAELPFDALGAFAVFGPLAGMGIGLWRAAATRPFCASCSARLDAGGATCPGCGGSISGNIKHPNERLDAEEKLRGSE